MGRPGITKDNVYKAAQAIADAGDIPTMHGVLNILGTGSLGTIHKHLLAWKQERILVPDDRDALLLAQIFRLEQENIELKNKYLNLEQKLNSVRELALDALATCS